MIGAGMTLYRAVLSMSTDPEDGEADVLEIIYSASSFDIAIERADFFSESIGVAAAYHVLSVSEEQE